LRAHVPGFAGPIVVTQFKGGQSNPTYLVETRCDAMCCGATARQSCLPLSAASPRIPGVSALFARGFPVAEPVLYCADEAIAGTAVFS